MNKTLASILLSTLAMGTSSALASTIIEVPVSATRMTLADSRLPYQMTILLQMPTLAGGHLSLNCSAGWEARLNVDLGGPHVTNAAFSAKVSAITEGLKECQDHVKEIHQNILNGHSKVRIEIRADQLVNVTTSR